MNRVVSRHELDPERLRRWMQVPKLDLPSIATASNPFIELSPLSLRPASECEVELKSEPRTKLRIRLSDQAIEQAESLAANFWRRSSPRRVIVCVKLCVTSWTRRSGRLGSNTWGPTGSVAHPD